MDFIISFSKLCTYLECIPGNIGIANSLESFDVFSLKMLLNSK